MITEEQIGKIKQYIYEQFKDDVTGHDYYHMRRVALCSKDIALKENSDPILCEVAGWVHDIGDQKLFSDPEYAKRNLCTFMKDIGLNDKVIDDINQTVKDVSFRKGAIPNTLEGKIVQDADRLDAIGAIGIARTFAYGGANN
ncbi:HD domain-containing protein [Oceanobacillus halotolerans]|uniref:HD domain-containing protein n=1 Tax=Oceanobacillus halotolerans TaxID=2663380 RepID=UPI001CF7E1E9|nr:HD domain-containing protein [Oceanobacillus halotolerans]